MRLVTSKEMSSLDKYAINTIGIPGLSLMELAGAGTARLIMERWPIDDAGITVVCGKGNNGGDGLVVARHLHNNGADVNIVLVGNENDLEGNSKINANIIKSLKIPLLEVLSTADIWDIEEVFHNADIIVDALFGIGLDRAVTGIYREIVTVVNASSAITVAVDMPSGVCADTGSIFDGKGIKADLTVTFAYPKVGQFTSPGFDYCGEIEVVDISIPRTSHGSDSLFLLNDQWVKNHLPPRKRSDHKGTFGHVLVFAGSTGKVGAAVMTCESALSMGAGLVTNVSENRVINILMQRFTEIMCEPLNEAEKELTIDDLDRFLALTKGKNVVAIGPGISTHDNVTELLSEFIQKCEIPMIIDADGLNHIAKNVDVLKGIKVPVILTPHPGEMSRLTGIPIKEIQNNRHVVAKDFAKKYGVYVVLKGARTVIASPYGQVAINPTGNPGMGTGGTGDVLTGFISAILAQDRSPFDAMAVAVYLHGRAGDLAAQEKGELSLRALDLISYLPSAFYSLELDGLMGYPQSPAKL
jgi:ADP-dependent NAD(P)H-hydrate dehydratase / NAD(P)H-hydrate epimerase